MSYRDRRSTSDAAEDQRLTGKLLHDAQTYSYRDDADPEFTSIVMRGCGTSQRGDYPPKGHDYPRRDR
ncbi:hypothetical protein BLA24_22475 [Streptomyces cinnamoneus]|uniref:Uncharacterized protein n=1 Tax=Streptomyces cinnamoneus TaxID=53446 RepID=A0A2G1XGG0_STRCJ|nr:hypothetical protein [Streptomyces cinnamoneus]PHQ50317.1 hypothetical protein BLA24_22475 [Streptomyces cinnamoneus]PPT12896.1 hypothetical protein CYQ11_08315 [Streptomyces cinnamoneus]